MVGLNLLELDHVVRLFDGGHVLDAILEGLCVQVVERLVLRAVLDVAESDGLPPKVLRLIHDAEAGLLHAPEELFAVLPVVGDAGDPEAHCFHALKPQDHGVRVVGGLVDHVQPSVVHPAKEGDVILVSFLVSGHHREPAMRDDDVHALVLPVQHGRCQVVHLGQVRAAVPLDGQLCELQELVLHRIELLKAQERARCGVAAAELLDVEVGVDGGDEHVEGLCQEVLALLGVVEGLHGVAHDVRRADGHAVVGVGLLVCLCTCKIDLAGLLIPISAAQEDEQAVILGHAVEDLPGIGDLLRAEGCAIVAGGGDTDDQFVGVGLGGFFEDVVVLGGFVGVHLVSDDDVAAQGVLCVRVGCQGIQADGSAGKALMRDHMVKGVVEDGPSVRFGCLLVLVHAGVQVVFPVAVGLQGLLQRCAHDVDLGAAGAFHDGQGPGECSDQDCLAVFSRDEDKRFFDDALDRAGEVEDQHAVQAELLPRLHQEWLAAQGLAVQCLTFAVLELGLYQGDDQVSIAGLDLVLSGLHHADEALAAQDPVLICGDASVCDALGVAPDVVRVHAAVQSQLGRG